MTANLYYFLFTLGVTIVVSFTPEKFLTPLPAKFASKTSNRCIILQSLLVTLLFIVVTLIVQRLIFASLAVSIFLIILSGVSNAKYQALREPLVFSDIAMFSQAFKHPRLYFPFLGLLPVIVMPLIIIALISTLLILEPALAFTWQRICITLIACVLCFFVSKKIAIKLSLSQEPETDNQQYGLLNSLFTYAIQADGYEHQQQIKKALDQSPFTIKKTVLSSEVETPPRFFDNPNNKPLENITIIQSESFFDARRLDQSINSNVLENYDACLEESIQFGKLNVPAWGANTMRTEFTFLTGLKYEDMGLYRYYPYQYLHKMPIVSFATLLQSQGYHCVCIHPHSASFFGRDRIFPKMGFDEFIDIEDFDKTQTFGPYISDQAVTDKILEINDKHHDSKKPLFIFAITMENHGPLHLEKATQDEQKQYYSTSSLSSPLKNINDLTVYLRHLKNADNMIKQLTSAYRKSDKPMTLCFYGDHIPSMPKVYKELAYEGGDSDYFIWNNQTADDSSTKTEQQSSSSKLDIKVDIKVDNLAQTLLKKTGNIQ